jgi:hypothetical protein
MTIIQAIAEYEGFNEPHTRAQRNNNPGNINFAPWTAEQFGAVLETIPAGINEQPRFACFPTVDQGWSALRTLLTKDYLGMTLIAAFNKYAPPVENNTNEYAAFVARETGLQLEDVLTEENIG